MGDPTWQDFYRIVQGPVLTARDFMSYEELGVSPRRPLSPADRDRWQGVSHYATFAAAVAAVAAHPQIGQYIATVRIPEARGIRVQQTGRDPDHFTIWAEARHLVGWAISVVRCP